MKKIACLDCSKQAIFICIPLALDEPLRTRSLLSTTLLPLPRADSVLSAA